MTELYKTNSPSKATYSTTLKSGRLSENQSFARSMPSNSCSSYLINIIYRLRKLRKNKQNAHISEDVEKLSGLKGLICWKSEVLLYLHCGLTGFLFLRVSAICCILYQL